MSTNKSDLRVLLSKVNTIGERICNQEDISQIDVDVLKDYVRTIYSVLLDFTIPETKTEPVKEKERSVESDIVEIEMHEQEQTPPSPASVDKQKPFVLEETFDFYTEGEFINDLSVEMNNESEQPQIEIERTEAENIVENTPSVLKYLHENIMNDAAKEKFSQPSLNFFNEKQTTVADKFSEKQTLNDRMTESIMGDLRTNIGVNEKFLFINELFFGNMKNYTDFIQSLNSSNDISQATEIINNYKQKNQWKEASLAFSTLIAIIEKRFKRKSL